MTSDPPEPAQGNRTSDRPEPAQGSRTSDRPEPAPGTLYVVSTPIGNLDDITVRALRLLRDVTVIAAEDTRTTGRLLRHFGIETPCVSCYAANERRRIPELLARLERGDSVAAVSDAGTPGLSDPAALLISAAVEHGIEVVAVPGASAALAALVVSGFRIDRFHFEGFLPIKKRRRARIEALRGETRTVILYESVHRLARTVRELRDALGGSRRIAVCRELTKRFEEVLRGTLDDLSARIERQPLRGEFVLVLEGAPGDDRNDVTEPEPEDGMEIEKDGVSELPDAEIEKDGVSELPDAETEKEEA